MNNPWPRYAKRIDALSLRERVFMFLSVALVIAALGDTLVLSPALAEQKQLAHKLQQQATELQALRTQLTGASLPAAASTPEGRLRASIAQLQSEDLALEGEIQRRLSSPDDMARLPDLLERTLRRHARLSLVKLETLREPPTVAAHTPAAPAAPSAARTTRLRWQGVDLAVSGHYLDLMNYLAELEQALPGLRWGDLHLGTTPAPGVLSVRLYLVGAAP